MTADLTPTWRKMEYLYETRKTRSIGVSNYRISDLTSLLSYARVLPAINQVELHPLLPSPALVSFCRSHGIAPVAYSPLGSQNPCPSSTPKLLENRILNEIALDKRADVAQILISWGLQMGWSVLPKSSDVERIRRNFEIVQLSDDDMKRLENSRDIEGEGRRFVNPIEIFGFDFFAGGERNV